MTYGHTYPVDAKDMMMIGPLFPGDEAVIKKSREDAAATNVFDVKSRTYRQK